MSSEHSESESETFDSKLYHGLILESNKPPEVKNWDKANETPPSIDTGEVAKAVTYVVTFFNLHRPRLRDSLKELDPVYA